jgi:hypothetical protein
VPPLLVTVTLADPETLVFCTEVALIVAVPVPEGVNRPLEFTLPSVAVHVTDWLGNPVPVTVALHWLVWDVVIEVGEQGTETPVTVLPLDGARATLTSTKEA